jgi:shikimate kinase
MDHIWLIGMMGTGKTTVGAIIAERLDMRVIDTDAEVMERSGRTIPELFDDSEATFRDWESAVIADIAAGPPAVVATGGGAILDPANVERMRTSGVRILLEADASTLEARGAADGERPLLRRSDDIAEINAGRRSRYRDAADHVVDTSGKDVGVVADEVVRCVST